jgi:hypothetical protein
MTPYLDLTPRHPALALLLRWFEHDHLPAHLQAVAEQFQLLAHAMADEYPDSPELTAGLRKLLEAKDCCVRAAVEAHRSKI